MSRLKGWKPACIVFVFLAATAIAAPAQTFTTLVTFNITNGAYPTGSLVQGFDGNLYGTASAGGRNICFNGCGTVFKISPAGTLTTVHEFVSTDGQNPSGALVLTSNGNFYGTTTSSSTSGGTFFEVSPGGTLTTLLGTGAAPSAGVMQANNGNFYGTTSMGGSDSAGTVFGITPSGTETVLHNFCRASSCGGLTGGYNPYAPLIQGTDGFLYGTTVLGGNDFQGSGQGTIFKIGYAGSLARLHVFEGTDGGDPFAALMQASDGNFYGTTSTFGANDGGTVFKMTPSGTLTTLYNFCAQAECADGADSRGGLVQGTDGNFYGTTYTGGADNYGTVFEITPAGSLTTLHSFDKTDGIYPIPGLVQATDGNFYGVTTGALGYHAYGTVFKLSMGLAPFTKTLPTSGNVGASVIILGTALTGATSVTFNGKAAAFSVVSPTEITTRVPSGATTGTVEVITPGGTLLSNVVFRVP
jgi:uncharacterized repeat protein (TIGR03803 family)